MTDKFLNLSTSFARHAEKSRQETKTIKKLDPSETFIALLKGYAALAYLYMPIAFSTGGWAVSTGMLTLCAVVTGICACKLIDVGLKYDLYSFPLIVEKGLGRKARILLDFMIAST